MTPILNQILDAVEAADRLHGRKLRKRLSAMGREYHERAEAYYLAYDQAMRAEGTSIEFGVSCYLKMCLDMQDERLNFLRTGKYANTSYKEVQSRIYSNPSIMDYHMHGLAITRSSGGWNNKKD